MQAKVTNSHAKESRAPGDEQESVWSGLVSRGIRATLARQDMSYADLAAALADMGVPDTFRGVQAKSQRGTCRFTFFLQVVLASRTDYPAAWEKALTATQSWEQRASAVLQSELSLQPWLTWAGLAARLSEIGVVVTSKDLESQAKSGTFPAALFLQCATVCRFEGIGRFVDVSSLNGAAVDGHQRAEQHR
ncbi:DUF6471 domain-containing protein [Paraburkholderia sp. ZP32-5]|uniref:DUF6471 domain-containing protein n=1 Tax=Paraburkholderia sp. ZP32-5 TaxID=2883245 RepID=UPI001F2D68A4|nr:DUF6471 domain-containing protein [Paraburkholderia sp. ZP32-5]